MSFEPVGDHTPEISGRLCETVRAAVATERPVVITLRSVTRFSWSGLCRLSEGLHAEWCLQRHITFRDVTPSKRCLLDAVDLARFVEPGGLPLPAR